MTVGTNRREVLAFTMKLGAKEVITDKLWKIDRAWCYAVTSNIHR